MDLWGRVVEFHSVFPRLKSRGLIEAVAIVLDGAINNPSFPRLKSRGLIEAQTAGLGLLEAASFFPRLKSRGLIEARYGDDGKRLGIAFPRLKSRGLIEAGNDGSASPHHRQTCFPRLKSRGLIEACFSTYLPLL